MTTVDALTPSKIAEKFFAIITETDIDMQKMIKETQNQLLYGNIVKDFIFTEGWENFKDELPSQFPTLEQLTSNIEYNIYRENVIAFFTGISSSDVGTDEFFTHKLKFVDSIRKTDKVLGLKLDDIITYLNGDIIELNQLRFPADNGGINDYYNLQIEAIIHDTLLFIKYLSLKFYDYENMTLETIINEISKQTLYVNGVRQNTFSESMTTTKEQINVIIRNLEIMEEGIRTKIPNQTDEFENPIYLFVRSQMNLLRVINDEFITKIISLS